MKNLRVSFMCSLLVATFAVAALAQSVQSDYDHTYNLGKLRTYGFYQQQRKAGDPLAASPLNDRRIHDALDAQLKLNGFAGNTTEKPDFMIAYFVTTRAAWTFRTTVSGSGEAATSTSIRRRKAPSLSSSSTLQLSRKSGAAWPAAKSTLRISIRT